MGTQTIQVGGIPDELLELLDEHVRQYGGDRDRFIRELIRRELQPDSPPAREASGPLASMSFAEILAPVHQQAAESGMTDEEMDRLFEEARERVREEKRAAQPR